MIEGSGPPAYAHLCPLSLLMPILDVPALFGSGLLLGCLTL